MGSYPFWYVLPLIGIALVLLAASYLAPKNESFSLTVPEKEGATNLTLPQLVWGSAFMTVSWSGAPASAEVSLFYCGSGMCPYENSSTLYTGRTAWTEFYGESGGNGSISDYWNNASPVTSTHFLVVATGVSAALPVLVSTAYHNPGPGYSWIEVSGLVAPEVIVTVTGILVVALGMYLRIRR